MNMSDYFMPEDKLFDKHPLPWEHRVLMVVDANKRTVVHLGGTSGTRPEQLCTLAGFIVETANRRYNKNT